MEFEDEFGIELPQLSVDKLMAAITIATTDVFFKDVARFIQLANVLSGSEFDPSTFDPATVVECAWAMTEALLLDPPEDKEDKFCSEICAYLAHVLKEEGFVTPPDILRIATGADASAQVAYDYAHDPELFADMYQHQHGKTQEVETMIREHLTELMEQLKSLPYQQGNTKEFEKRVKQFTESHHV